MKSEYRYQDKKPLVISELKKLAKAGKLQRYGDFGLVVGIPIRGPWKPILDDISRDQTAQGLPDITHLLVGADTGYPHQINFEDSARPTRAQKKEFDLIMDDIRKHYQRVDRKP